MNQAQPFLEVKRRPDGREETYTCELVRYDGGFAIARYVYERDFHADGRALRKGGWTLAWYWQRRPYLLYRMYGPDGRHIADRFDVVDHVRLRESGVEYRDLYVDMWVDSASPQLEDEHELAEAEAKGLLTAKEAESARRTGRLLLRDYRRIIDEAARLLLDTRSP